MAVDERMEPDWSQLSPRIRKRISEAVFEAKGRTCTLRLPMCTGLATTVDHTIPNSQGGPHTVENLEPACKPCNQARGDSGTGGDGRHGARVVVVIGPPAAGKTTWVTEHAAADDVVIDHDALCLALQPGGAVSHHAPAHVRAVATAARTEAIHTASRLSQRVTVWVIHALPSAVDLAGYRRRGWALEVVDPGEDTVRQRLAGLDRSSRAIAGVVRWYAGIPGLNRDEQLKTKTNRGHAPSRDW